MGDDNAYWVWRDAVMAHPDGRAKGGEACVQCGNPVPPNAHWKHRDRHVCSPRCNLTLSRKFNRMRAGARPRDGSVLLPQPDGRPNPRTRQADATFGMLDGPFPYDFDGYGPQPGDSITRHGSTTHYLLADTAALAPLLTSHGLPAYLLDRPVLLAVHDPTATAMLTAADPSDLTPTRLGLGMLTDYRRDPSKVRYTGAVPREWDPLVGDDGVEYCWRSENIRDALADGTDLTWHARVCVPAAIPNEYPLWSPAYTARSERLGRVSATVARHARRVRVESGAVERFDALEVFERDGWVCGICGQLMDPVLKWPEPRSASLDHVLPLAAGGEHTRANTQAAHLICNIRKGARTSY